MPDAYRVLVTGSRDWQEPAVVWRELGRIGRAVGYGIMVVVHGACPRGADRFADMWGATWPVTVERHPADWDGPHGRAAGYRRNAEMVALGANECLAFIRNGSRGATHCAGLAEKAGIPVRRFTSDT